MIELKSTGIYQKSFVRSNFTNLHAMHEASSISCISGIGYWIGWVLLFKSLKSAQRHKSSLGRSLGKFTTDEFQSFGIIAYLVPIIFVICYPRSLLLQVINNGAYVLLAH